MEAVDTNHGSGEEPVLRLERPTPKVSDVDLVPAPGEFARDLKC
jgi:hypothetical protein